jgi:hypothetical protein
LTNGSGATIVTARSVAAPNLADKRASAIGIGQRHTHNLTVKAKAAGVGHSDGDGLTNAVICIAVMLACVIAYILLARAFMA